MKQFDITKYKTHDFGRVLNIMTKLYPVQCGLVRLWDPNRSIYFATSGT